MFHKEPILLLDAAIGNFVMIMSTKTVRTLSDSKTQPTNSICENPGSRSASDSEGAFLGLL